MASKIQKLKDRAMHVLAGDIEDRSKADLVSYPTTPEVSMRDQGTTWVVPGRGSSLALLREAIGQEAGPGESRIRTALLLTGSLLDRRDVDRIREVIAQPELHQVAA